MLALALTFMGQAGFLLRLHRALRDSLPVMFQTRRRLCGCWVMLVGVTCFTLGNSGRCPCGCGIIPNLNLLPGGAPSPRTASGTGTYVGVITPSLLHAR